MRLACFERASGLPPKWDELVTAADHPFLTRDFLQFLEETNPCEQRYYLSEEEDLLFVTYCLRLDLLTFTGGHGPKWKVRILGVPLSVSREGFILAPGAGFGVLERALDAVGGGWTLLLNVPDSYRPSLPGGRTLPSYVLPLPFSSVAAYKTALKSHYRRRLNKIQSGGSALIERQAKPNEIKTHLYPLYREVYDRSEAKLECLPPAYFETFPGKTQVITLEDRPVAFYQTLESQTKEYFVLGGFNREGMDPSTLYPYLLHRLVVGAIEKGKAAIDLGQTADETKARSGAKAVEKGFFLHHRSPWLRTGIRWIVPLFSYRDPVPPHHVFNNRAKTYG